MRNKRDVCSKCGEGPKFSILDTYHYRESGLQNVFLQDVETVSCGCGTSVVLTAVPTLLRVIASCFAYKPARLTGREMRFIRQVLGRKARDFAQAISISPEHLSRLENAEDDHPSPSLDKLVRARLVVELISSHPETMRGFDLEAFESIIDGELQSDDRLALYVKYVGPYLKDRVEFEFKKAA